MNKLGLNFEQNYEIDPECGVLAMIVRPSIFMTKLPSEADAKNRLTCKILAACRKGKIWIKSLAY